MASKIVQFQDKDGNIVNFEVYESEVPTESDGMTLAGGSITQTAKDVIEGAKQSLEDGLQPFKTAITHIKSLIDEVEPAEVEVSFGLKMNSEVGVVIGKFGGEATIGIKMKWTKDKEKTQK